MFAVFFCYRLTGSCQSFLNANSTVLGFIKICQIQPSVNMDFYRLFMTQSHPAHPLYQLKLHMQCT